MTCEECAARQAGLAASEQLLAEKRFKYRHESVFSLLRLLGDYEHQVETARANLERHMAECTEEKDMPEYRIKHRCMVCGCLWSLNPPSDVQPDGSWSLWDADQKPGKCCNNEAMGDQIERVDQ